MEDTSPCPTTTEEALKVMRMFIELIESETLNESEEYIQELTGGIAIDIVGIVEIIAGAQESQNNPMKRMEEAVMKLREKNCKRNLPYKSADEFVPKTVSYPDEIAPVPPEMTSVCPPKSLLSDETSTTVTTMLDIDCLPTGAACLPTDITSYAMELAGILPHTNDSVSLDIPAVSAPDTTAGPSHLPQVTVVTPLIIKGRKRAKNNCPIIIQSRIYNTRSLGYSVPLLLASV